MGKHLGDSIHELLDGRLRGDKAYAAMAHLGECQECAARFHELRAARDALSSSQCGIDMRFAQQLLDRNRIAEIAAATPAQHRLLPRGGRKRRVPVVAVMVMVILVVGVVSVGYHVGEPDEVSLEFAKAREGNAVNVAYMDTQQMRSDETLRSWIHPNFATSELVPVEASVVRTSNGQSALVATVLFRAEPLTVVQQHGQLAEDHTAGLQRADVDAAEVFVVSPSAPAAVVWQTGDVVVALSCECSLSTLEEAAGEFPTAADPGFVERVGDGLGSLVSALGN